MSTKIAKPAPDAMNEAAKMAPLKDEEPGPTVPNAANTSVNENVMTKPSQTAADWDEYDEDSVSEEAEDDDMDDAEFEKRKKIMTGGKGRGQVVSESIEVDPNWQPPVYPKTPAEEALLTKCLNSSFLFKNMGNANFAKVLAAFKKEKIAQGETVIVEGAEVSPTESGLYVLEKGNLAVFKKDGDKRKKIKEYKTPGDFFGELALLYNNPRAATIIASKKCVLWSITRDVFNNLVKQSASSDKSNLEEFLSKVQLLKDFSNRDRSKLADAMSTRTYDIGSKIITEGDAGSEFYIIKSGRCIVEKEGHVIHEYGPTSFFGELALLHDEPRAATIIAVTAVEVMLLERSSFKRLLDVKGLFDSLKDSYKGRAMSLSGPILDVGNFSEYENEDEDEDSEFTSGSMDEAEFARRQKLMANKGTRGSVIGERFVAKDDYEPPVYPKTDEQRDRLQSVLVKSFMFSSLRASDLQRVISAFKEHQVRKDIVVITQGNEVSGDDPGLYVIEKGSLDVYKGAQPPNKLAEPGQSIRSSGNWCCAVTTEVDFSNYGPKVFTYTNPGQNFGELALLYNAPRAATVVSASECILWSITREVFNNCVKNAMVKEKEQQEKCLSRVEILEKLHEHEVAKIVDALITKTWKTGDHIITQGDAGDEFYILEEGEAYAEINGVNVKEYKPSDYFGERALVRNEPRAANVIAKTDVRVLTLDRASFTRILGPLDQILQERIAQYQTVQK